MLLVRLMLPKKNSEKFDLEEIEAKFGCSAGVEAILKQLRYILFEQNGNITILKTKPHYGEVLIKTNKQCTVDLKEVLREYIKEKLECLKPYDAFICFTKDEWKKMKNAATGAEIKKVVPIADRPVSLEHYALGGVATPYED